MERRGNVDDLLELLTASHRCHTNFRAYWCAPRVLSKQQPEIVLRCGEGALRQKTGATEVMRAQLRALASLSRRSPEVDGAGVAGTHESHPNLLARVSGD